MRGSYLSAICIACFPIDQFPCHLSIYGCELDPCLVIGPTRKRQQCPKKKGKKKKKKKLDIGRNLSSEKYSHLKRKI